MATLVKSFAIQGIDGYRVDIEVTTLDGQPMLSIIGLGDLAVKEAGERIQAAMDSCGYDFPKKKVIINLAPGDKKKNRTYRHRLKDRCFHARRDPGFFVPVWGKEDAHGKQNQRHHSGNRWGYHWA